MLAMPGKSPQKQVMCQSGYLVPEAFKKEHEVLMKKLVDNIELLVYRTFEYFDWDDWTEDEPYFEEEETWSIAEYLSCTIEDQLELDLEDRDY
jgi:hypothetical protein